MSALELRPLQPADLPVLCQLLGELDEGPPVEPATAAATLAAMQAFPGYRCFVAERGETVVGTLSMLVFPVLSRHARREAIVDAVVVAHERRGQGIGRAMMAAALQLAADQGAYKLALSSNQRRTGAHDFYRALGFEQHGLSFSIATGIHP